MLKLSKELSSLLATVDSDTVQVETSKGVQNNSGKKLFNVLTKEYLELLKKVEVSTKVVDKKKYKADKVKEYLKNQVVTTYTKGVIDTAYNYILSGYTVNINEVSLKEVKEMLQYAPSKASVKKDFKEALSKAKAKYNDDKKKEVKDNTSDTIKDICSKLSTDELLEMKKYLASIITKEA